MASKTEICNMALFRVGKFPVTNVDTDTTQDAIRLRTIYDICLDSVIVFGEWSSCIRRATLNQTANTPVFEFTYEYQLPTLPRNLKVLTINEEEYNGDDCSKYKIEGDKLYTDDDEVNIRYVARLTSTNDYGPFLTEAMISRLIAELSYSATAKPEVSQAIWQKYYGDVAMQMSMDGQQGSNESYLSKTSLSYRTRG